MLTPKPFKPSCFKQNRWVGPVARRDLLKAGLIVAGGLVTSGVRAAQVGSVGDARLNPGTLEPFVDPLPLLPRARPVNYRPGPHGERIPHYRLAMGEFVARVHRNLPPTRMWGYEGQSPGPLIEAQADRPVTVEWLNRLPSRHLFKVDRRLCGAETSPEVRTVVHLHGARVSAENDGYPENWYTPGKSVTFSYSNRQEAAALWYHDHAIGITRLNNYAGLFGPYILRDALEKSLRLPQDNYEVPLVVYDRVLTSDGRLEYPVSPDPAAPSVSEMLGNAILVNGKLLPYLEVEPRRYRFRLINASNGRTFQFTFANGQSFHLIGTDQGFRDAPLELSSLVVAPAERADVIVDFRDHRGDRLLLRTGGDPVMQFRVGTSQTADPSVVPARLRPLARLAEGSAVKTRVLTLDEADDSRGYPMKMLLNGSGWRDPISEKPELGTTEIWSFVNRTEDVHPIHLHGVRFQLLDRGVFDPMAFSRSRTIRVVGTPPPDPEEQGWKDTIRVFPQTVTRIVVPFEVYAGRFVWHCHVLEHEDNEMMRPYEIVAKGGSAA